MDIKDLINQLIAWKVRQADIGKAIGVSQTTVSKIHRGVQDDIGYRHYLKLVALHKDTKRWADRKAKKVPA